jgi:catechol 2,3-dioxygenase-like lactoylglutathione lyase family enzyme
MNATKEDPAMSDSRVNVRYMVNDVPQSVDWYVSKFGFQPVGPQSPAFAAVERGPLRLLLSGRGSSAGRPMPDGWQPEPGGWTRFQFIVEDVGAEVERLRAQGVKFRNDIVTGPGGSQILAEDPSGNVVELFQPAAWG